MNNKTEFKIGNVYVYTNSTKCLYIGILMEIGENNFLQFKTLYDSFNFLSLTTGLVPLDAQDMKECKDYSEKDKLALILKYS